MQRKQQSARANKTARGTRQRHTAKHRQPRRIGVSCGEFTTDNPQGDFHEQPK
jgi:hypothetical protein